MKCEKSIEIQNLKQKTFKVFKGLFMNNVFTNYHSKQ